MWSFDNLTDWIQELKIKSVSERLAELRMKNGNTNVTEWKKAGWGKDMKHEANVVVSRVDE